MRQQCVSTRARVHSNAKRHALKPRLELPLRRSQQQVPCRLVVSVALWPRQPRFDSRCGQRCVEQLHTCAVAHSLVRAPVSDPESAPTKRTKRGNLCPWLRQPAARLRQAAAWLSRPAAWKRQPAASPRLVAPTRRPAAPRCSLAASTTCCLAVVRKTHLTRRDSVAHNRALLQQPIRGYGTGAPKTFPDNVTPMRNTVMGRDHESPREQARPPGRALLNAFARVLVQGCVCSGCLLVQRPAFKTC